MELGMKIYMNFQTNLQGLEVKFIRGVDISEV